jgi:hypothetical protein
VLPSKGCHFADLLVWVMAGPMPVPPAVVLRWNQPDRDLVFCVLFWNSRAALMLAL